MSGSKDNREEDRENEPLWVWIALIGISYIVYIGEGQVRIFGMFYVEWIDLHDTTPLMTSWVGFVFSLPNIFISPFIGFMADRWSMRTIVFVSGIIGAAGMLVAAFASSIGWVIVGYGILYGLSDCFSMSVALALINKYFDRHLALSSGIAWCAGSIGGITMPFVIEGLNNVYSSRGTLIIIAGIRLNLSVAGMVLRPVKELYKLREAKAKDTSIPYSLPPSPPSSPRESPQKSPHENIQMTNVSDNAAYLNDSIVSEASTDGITAAYRTMDIVSSKNKDLPSNNDNVNYSNELQLNVSNVEQHSKNMVMNGIPQMDNKSTEGRCCKNAPSWIHYVFNVKFLTFSVFWFCGMMGFYSIIQFTPPFLEEFGFEDQTARLLGISGGADLAGRILFGAIGDLRCTNINMAVAVNVVICGTMAFIVSIFPILPLLIVFMMAMGALGGSLWGLCGPLVVDAIGKEHAGLGGALREATGSYRVVLYLGGTAYFISFFSFMILGRRYPKIKFLKSSTYSVNA